MLDLLIPPFLETIYMVSVSTVFSLIIGFPLGILLVITEKDGLWEKILLNNILNTVINILRSIPFIILIILLFPLSSLIVGTKIGTTATIVPLSIAAAPFVARLMEGSFKEVDPGLIELGVSIGGNTYEIIKKVLIPEALPSIISGITLTIINLIGYSAMAGAVGGGGLGNLALQYGYYRYQTDVMILCVIVIVILVQMIQWLGNKLALRVNKK